MTEPNHYYAANRIEEHAAELRAAVDGLSRTNPTYAQREAIETAAERIAQAAAPIAGGQYRPAYNGWVNRETWNASLWIGNDADTYETARELVRAEMDGSDYDTRGQVSPADDRRYQIRTAGEALSRWYDDRYAPADCAGPLADAWTYALAWTDWYAVADGLAEDMPAAGSGYLPR